MPRIVAAPQPGAPPGAPAQVAIVEPGPPARTVPPVETPLPARGKRAAAERSPPPTRITARPSFNCRYARTSTEKMVCGSPRLAARDREMASLWYALMARADPATRNHLRRTRDVFLGRREDCGSEACVDAAYVSRMAELKRIASGD
jgi:hypothetical protein